VTDASTAQEAADEAKIYSFQVGHGDCTLIEFSQEGSVRFRMLVDAGQALPSARLLERLSLDSGGELSNLLMRSPLPLQWLLEPELPPPDEDEWSGLRARFRSSVSL
jgi:hypothetical protein